MSTKGGHFMLTICNCTDLWAHGVLEENLNTYFYVAFRPRESATTQGYASSCALQTRDPVWFDTLRLECDALDGHAILCVYVFAVPGDPRYEGMETLKDRSVEAKKLPATSAKKTPLELKLEGMRKAAAKRQREEQHKLAAQAAADAESGARQLSAGERQWLEFKNYFAMVEKNQGIELHVPAVPEHHVPVGFIYITAKQLRHSARTSYLIEMERGLQCGQGRIHVELEFRPRLLTALDIPSEKVLTPRQESFDIEVGEEFRRAGVEWLLPEKVGVGGGRSKDKRGSKADGNAASGGGEDVLQLTRKDGQRNALRSPLSTTQGHASRTAGREVETDQALYLPTG